MRYEIGETVWVASFESTTDSVTCPECGGAGRIRCLMYDDTMVSVECQGCSRGYEGPQGVIRVYTRKPMAVETTITGVSIRNGKPEWQTKSSWSTPEEDIFTNRLMAEERAAIKAAKLDQEERDKVANKEKDTRSWSWNAHYHRKEIRDLEKRIEYHRAKLSVASLKAKEKAA